MLVISHRQCASNVCTRYTIENGDVTVATVSAAFTPRPDDAFTQTTADSLAM